MSLLAQIAQTVLGDSDPLAMAVREANLVELAADLQQKLMAVDESLERFRNLDERLDQLKNLEERFEDRCKALEDNMVERFDKFEERLY